LVEPVNQKWKTWNVLYNIAKLVKKRKKYTHMALFLHFL
jgi:hypothetical protein